MNKKNGTKICAMLMLVLFIAQVGAGASTRLSPSKDVVGDERGKQRADDSQVMDLAGSITANVCNGSGGILKGLVYPTIDMPGEQSLSFNTSKVNGSWDVNTTLRIKVNKPELTNKTYLIPRCLTVFVVVIRKNQPLISGLLRDLILGKKLMRINVFNEGSSDYVEIPLVYESKKQDEEQRVFIVAVGSLMGMLAGSPPIFILKTVDISCHYSTATEDVSPPFTTITLTGEEIEEGVFIGDVRVSFLSTDELSEVDYTTYEYTLTTGTAEYHSDWTTYSEPQTYSEAGQYMFNYYSVDKADNVESTKSEAFIVMD